MKEVLAVLLQTCFLALVHGKTFDVSPKNIMQLAYKDEIAKLKTKLETNMLLENEINRLFSNDITSKIKYYFYDSNKLTFTLFDPNNIESVKKLGIDPQKPTKVLIHGWMDYVHGEMMAAIVEGFQKSMEAVNVICIDWGDLSINLDYFGPASKVGPVGKEAATALDRLITSGVIRLQDLHVIGHSLGAHVAGSVGDNLKSGRLPRITGLDPAAPGFILVKIGRDLQTSDALFVDCIHTCGDLLGIMTPFCHVDYYPNGGTFAQPGCSKLDFGKCSHFRSFEYFGESIMKNHRFPAKRCSDVKNVKGCQDSQYLMGYHLNSSATGTFYGQTNSEYPYATIEE